MTNVVLRASADAFTMYFLYQNIDQKNVSAKRIFFSMSTSRSGLRVKYHDIVRVRHNQKREETLIKGRIKCQYYLCSE